MLIVREFNELHNDERQTVAFVNRCGVAELCVRAAAQLSILINIPPLLMFNIV